MAKKIGNLAVVVSANTAALQKGMLRGGNMVMGFAKHVNSAADFVKDHLLGIGLAAAAGTFGVEHLRQVAEAMDKTAKTADRLGLTTEALIGLRHAANLAGLGADEFDGALQSMEKNVGLAARGLGRARSAFDFLHIKIDELAKLSPENQFKVLAEYVNSVTDPTQRLTLAMQIFGDQGAQIINVVSEGAAGLEKMQQEAVDLGLSFSRVDAAQVEAANDALTRMGAIFTGLSQQLVIELAPYITAAADAFTEWAKSGKGAGAEIVAAVEWVATTVAELMDIIDYGKIAWQGLKIAANLVLLGLFKSVELFGRAITKIIDMASDFLPQALVDGAHEANATLGALNQELVNNIDESKKKIESIWSGPSRADATKKMFDDIKAKAKETANAVAAGAPKPEAFNAGMIDQVRKTEEEAQKVLDIQEKIADLRFEPNNLIRAGSAQAQALPFVMAQRQRDQQVQKQIDLQNKQLDELRKIGKNTEALEPEEVY